MNRAEFDKRYTVEPVPYGRGFYIRDNVERKIEVGPLPARYRAEACLSFMRAHCDA